MEADGGGGGSGGNGGRASSQNGVALPSHGGDRQCFYVELRPGETTIVSWKRLIKEATACPPPADPSSADFVQDSRDAQWSLNGCYQENQSTVEHQFSVNAEKSGNVDRATMNSSSQPKKRRKGVAKAPGQMIKDYESDKMRTMKARLSLTARDSPCVDVLSSQPYFKAVGSLQIINAALQSPSTSPVIIAADGASNSSSENAHSAMSKSDASASPKYSKEMDNYVSRPNQSQALGSSVQSKRKIVSSASKSNRGSFKQSNPLAQRLVPSASDMEFSKKLCPKTGKELPDLNTPVSPAQFRV